MIPEKFEPEKHYEEVVLWMNARGWPVLPLELLPEDGFIVPGVCCAFVYTSEKCKSLAFMEWIFTNPEASSNDRNDGLDLVIEKIYSFCRSKGVISVVTYLNDSGLIDRIVKSGGEISETDMVGVIRRL